jgi:hypothetical protein
MYREILIIIAGNQTDIGMESPKYGYIQPTWVALVV